MTLFHTFRESFLLFIAFTRFFRVAGLALHTALAGLNFEIAGESGVLNRF